MQFIKILIVFVLFSYSNTVNSQRGYKSLEENKVLDSLKHVFTSSRNDSIKCMILFKISKEYMKKNDSKNFDIYHKKALKLVGNNSFLKDYSFYNSSGYYFLKQDYDSYIKHLIEAEKSFRKYKIKDVYKIRAGILFNKSVHNRLLNSKESMRILIEEALPVAKLADDFEMCVMIYKSIGVIFYNEKEYNEANYYVLQSIDTQITKKIHNQELLLSNYLLRAEILIGLKKYRAAYVSIKKAEVILKEYPDSEYQILYNFTFGSYFHYIKSYERALYYFDEAIRRSKIAGDYFMANRSDLMKVLSLKELQKYQEAKTILERIYKDSLVIKEDKIEYLKELGYINKKLNNLPESINAYEKYIASSDSLRELQYREELKKMESAFSKLEAKERYNKVNYEKRTAIEIAKNNHLKYALFLLLSVLLVVILILFWIKYSKQKKINSEKEIALHQKISLLKNEKELVALYSMMEGEENERKRIAKDLHDGLGSSLSSIKMRVGNMASSEINKEELKTIYNLLDNSVKELRQVAYNLIPETLLKLGLDQALNDLCFNYSTNQITISYQSGQISENIIKPHQITIYRIVQELIHNAVKHSEGTKIIVDCSQNENLFLIAVEDNGKGFDVEAIEKQKGIGFKSVKSRVELLDGSMEIISNETEGTTINIELYITKTT